MGSLAVQVERARTAIVAIALVLFVGCGAGLDTLRPIVLHAPRAAASRAVFDRLVSSAEHMGYQPVVVQPDRGRFGVVARYTERDDGYRIAVECFSDGSIRLTPIGARVELIEGYYILPGELRREMIAFARDLQPALR
jgi:hypothetical protein